MIQILGIKRVLTLAMLIAVNLVLAGFLYGVVVPGEATTQNDLRRTRGAVESRRTEIQRLKTEYQEVQEQKTQFGDLEHAGFFGMQDRVQARKTMEAIQEKSRVLSARYNINAVAVKENPLAAESDHVLLQSPVSVSIDALDDIDLYSFMYLIENSFPGNAIITDITIDRKADIDENALKAIGNGIPTVLVSANVNFSWNTFVARSDLPPQLVNPATPQ